MKGPASVARTVRLAVSLSASAYPALFRFMVRLLIRGLSLIWLSDFSAFLRHRFGPRGVRRGPLLVEEPPNRPIQNH